MKKSFLLLLLLGALQCRQAEKTNPSLFSSPQITAFTPDLVKVLEPNASLEVLASGYQWSEGPVWVSTGQFLLFSDVPRDTVWRWQEGQKPMPYLTPSGFTGDSTLSPEKGANGLLIDAAGRLVLCQHGNRQVALMTAPLNAPQATYQSLASRYQGKRFNSPNDAAFGPQGHLWFTDPPYGLPNEGAHPSRELPFSGVYRVSPDGRVTLMVDSLTFPNGIAFSPDGKTLYVAVSDPKHAVWMAYDVEKDTVLSNGRLFYDATKEVSQGLPGLPDGLKVRADGTIFATGPGGVWIFNPQGKPLGRIDTRAAAANCAFGPDQKSLFITADSTLLRLKGLR